MLSRASALPRACIACRTGVALRRAAPRTDATPGHPSQPPRRASSDCVQGSSAAGEARLADVIAEKFRQDFLVRESLDLEALGKPVTALIIRDLDELRPRPRPRPVPLIEGEPPSDDTHVCIDDALPEQEESGQVLATAFANMDELRPRHKRCLSAREFEKLLGSLIDGFTTVQLESYYTSQVKNSVPVKSYPWITRYRRWRAYRKPGPESITAKQRAAAKIIRGSWGIEMRDRPEDTRLASLIDQAQDSRLGRMLVWLRPHIFELLFRPSSPYLQTLTAQVLEPARGWKISPIPRLRGLEILGPQAAARAVLARIDDMVRSIRTKTLQVESLRGYELKTQVLDKLGRVTNTLVEYARQDSKVLITWVADSTMAALSNETHEHAQDPADVVLRLLLAQKTAPSKLVFRPSTSNTASAVVADAAFKGHRPHDPALSRIDRTRQWFRCVHPVAAKRRGTPGEKLSILDSIPLPYPPFKTKVGESTNHVTATFGHVLHPGPYTKFGFIKARRILSPVVPHPRLLAPVGLGRDKPPSQSTSIVIKFHPADALEGHQDRGAPPLRLTLPVDLRRSLSSVTVPAEAALLEAVLAPWQFTDVLLPDEAVDVRLVQQRVRFLDAAAQPSLDEFLAKCDLDLARGRLSTPTRARFSIPYKLLSVKSPEAGKRPGGPRPAQLAEPRRREPADVPYLLLGLEIHQAVDLDLDGITLRYSSIDAGPLGGQRRELSLRGVSGGRDGADPEAADESRRFRRAVEDVATGRLFAWERDNGAQCQHPASDADMIDLEAVAARALPAERDLGPVLDPARPPANFSDAAAAHDSACGGAAPLHEVASLTQLSSSARPAPAPVAGEPDWATRLRSR